MNPTHIALIGIRIVAIYLIAQGISSIPGVYLFISTYDPEGSYNTILYGSVLIAIFSPIIIGIALWFSAPKLSNYFISTHPTSENNPELNVSQLQSAVIVLIGVYLIAVSIPALFSVYYQLINMTPEVNGSKTINISILSNAISVTIKLLFGVALILGSNFIVRGISKLRTIGIN